VFALEWQPQWSQPPSCDEKLANHLSPDSYAATHFSVHGLWPNYDSGLHNGSSWPQYCTRPVGGQVFTDCESDPTAHPYCTPSGAATLFNTSSGWQRYGLEYAWSDLARHEWAKHGSCTPWTQERYFEHIQDMHGRLANGSGAALAAANVGGSVAREDLAAAFQKDTDGKKVRSKTRLGKGHFKPHGRVNGIFRVRFCAKDFQSNFQISREGRHQVGFVGLVISIGFQNPCTKMIG